MKVEYPSDDYREIVIKAETSFEQDFINKFVGHQCDDKQMRVRSCKPFVNGDLFIVISKKEVEKAT